MAKLAHFFLDVDMRCGHEGLMEVIRKEKIKIQEGDYIVFLNTKRNIIKMFCGSEEAILHYKQDGRIIDPGIIKYLPKYCGGSRMNVDAAMKEFLIDMIDRRKG